MDTKIVLLKECLTLINTIPNKKYVHNETPTNSYELAAKIEKVLKEYEIISTAFLTTCS